MDLSLYLVVYGAMEAYYHQKPFLDSLQYHSFDDCTSHQPSDKDTDEHNISSTRGRFNINKYIKPENIVAGLKIAFSLSREVPALFQKVSRLLAVLYKLSPLIKEIKMAETSLSASQWASYFQQASTGTHWNYEFLTRVKRAEDKYIAGNGDIDESSLPTTTSHCLQLPPRRVTELEKFIHAFYRSLPKITIVCMSFLEADMGNLVGEHLEKTETKSWMMISRIFMDHMPSCIISPIRDTLETQSDPDRDISKSDNPSWVCRWSGTIVERLAPEYKSIQLAKHELFEEKISSDDKWRSLDDRLFNFLEDMQTKWIDPWQNLLVGESPSDPMVLVMDPEFQMLPLENVKVLSNKEVYRMPSVTSLVSTLFIHSRDFKDASLFPTIDPRKAFYLFNADDDIDLPKIADWFANSKMKGIANSKPEEDDLRVALTTNDLYIYLSHDSGEQYIAGSVVQDLDKCAAALLLGCSSGLLTLCGSLRYKGAPIDYLLGGSPSIFCNLWDVSTRSMEWYTMTLVEELLDTVTKGEHDDAPVYLGSFLTKLRKENKLRYLWGAATVCYGVPTSISSEGT